MAHSIDTTVPFGDWLLQRRLALQLTHAALAARVGYASATLQQIECGRRTPSRRLSQRLADALEIPVHEQPRFLRFARPADSRAAQRLPVTVPGVPAPVRLRPRAPAPSGVLIGRDDERATLVRWLRSAGERLVTVAGPGGIGKTSLALHCAADLATEPRFCDGVAIAMLDSLPSADGLPLAIADALGLPLLGARPVEDQVVEVLRERALLLVLDNCEQLLGQGDGVTLSALLGRLLAEAPRLAVLATSRERFRLRSERVLALEGLAVPRAATGPPVEQAAAVQLFMERAQRASPTLVVRGDDRQTVAQICRRLDGMPLAIELAAAWSRALSLREIARELDRALDFLAGADRDVPARQRSVRAALDHSWQLLSDAERRILARLSVFRGGCDRDAAGDVAGATLPELVALIDKSLVHAVATDGVTRYHLHELVRSYATERLGDDPAEQQRAEDRHMAFFRALLGRSIAAATGSASAEHWPALLRDVDNLRRRGAQPASPPQSRPCRHCEPLRGA